VCGETGRFCVIVGLTRTGGWNTDSLTTRPIRPNSDDDIGFDENLGREIRDGDVRAWNEPQRQVAERTPPTSLASGVGTPSRNLAFLAT
jgi:hypothetical protein